MAETIPWREAKPNDRLRITHDCVVHAAPIAGALVVRFDGDEYLYSITALALDAPTTVVERLPRAWKRGDRAIWAGETVEVIGEPRTSRDAGLEVPVWCEFRGFLSIKPGRLEPVVEP